MSYDDYYQTMDERQAFDNVKALIHGPADRFLNDAANPLRRIVPGKPGFANVNVVIVLEESLGARFSKKLRNNELDLTPRLDALMDKSLTFRRFYSTGTRTVRALEAINASFPPIPGASIVKRDQSDHIATIARTLKTAGYRTVFIYGGRGLFDNMRGFMLKNGYDRFIEQSDYPSPTFTSAWGVCDEDIFNKSLQTFDEMQAAGKPFFATILTVSNHKPYTYPKGRIDLDPAQHSRDHAVKYADWALGDFFEKAATHPFYKNTIFLLLGDHGARVYGADFIPIESYEIPLLIHAPALLPAPHMIDTLACSMDLAPTILGMLGIEYPSTFYGRDLFRLRTEQNYVLLQHDRDVGFFDGTKLAVLSTQKSAGVYDYDPANKRFSKDKNNSDANQSLIRNAISFYETAYHLYSNEQYTVSASTPVAR
jgi:phosphoglycerol transferase MdoB-like AlkP superfamily enzyme